MFIYFIYKFMLLKLPKLNFCSLNRSYFKAADKILQTILNHNHHIVERPQILSRMLDQQRAQALINNRKCRTLLSDKILDSLKQNKNIDAKVVRELSDIFDPMLGLQLKNIKLQLGKYRFNQGSNESKRFPFHPNSSLMKFFLNIFYEGQQNSYNLRQGEIAVHIVGTPGIGKSSSLYLLKHLHDLKIKHIIQTNNCQDSIFKQNCKFYYFHSLSKTKYIMNRMLNELKKDFGIIPQYVSRIKMSPQNYQSFIQAIQYAYGQKQIRIRVIVDQANSLYDKQQLSVDNWQKFTTLTTPMFLISSKYQPYLQQSRDPVLCIAGSENSAFLTKVNMDNKILSDLRLTNAVSCLIFQIQRKGVGRNKAIQIVEKMKYIPLMSHLAIRKIMESKQAQQFFNKIRNKQSQISDEFLNWFQSALNKNFGLTELKKSVLKLNQAIGSINQKQKPQLSDHLLILSYILSFFNKEIVQREISADIQIQEQNSQKKRIIKLKLPTLTRNFQLSKDIPFEKFFDANYIFKSRFLCQKQEKSLLVTPEAKSQSFSRQILFLCLSLNQLRQMRLFLRQTINESFIKNINKAFPQFAKILQHQLQELIFQNLVCQVFEARKQNQSLQVLMKQTNSSYTLKLQFINPALQNQLNLEQNQPLIINEAVDGKTISEVQFIKYALIQGEFGSYMRVNKKIPTLVFDFMLSCFDNGVLKLTLVDLVWGGKLINSKINNFYDKILKKSNFKKLIQLFSNEEVVKQIQICLYALRSTEKHCKKMAEREKSRMNQQDYKEKPLTEEQINIRITQFKQISQKIRIIRVQKGYYNEKFKVFVNDKIDQTVENFCTARIESINTQDQKQK